MSINRIGTANMYDSTINNLGSRQSSLVDLMEKTTAGKRVLRASDADSSFDSLCRFIDVYHARASWIETHPVEVRFANLEVMAGGTGINWERVLPTGPTF